MNPDVPKEMLDVFKARQEWVKDEEEQYSAGRFEPAVPACLSSHT
jgi:hypothetical protein